MISKRTVFFLLIFVCSSVFLFAQQDTAKINPNGYNVFYYPNGFKLSEGYLKNGKPDGYWVTYYVNGKKKSEGNRKNFLLDSLWIFYAENGDTTETIYYVQGKKNGFDTKYYTRFDSAGMNVSKSKELYIDGKRQGFSYFYYPDGKLHYKIKFKDNYKHGVGFEYAEDGRLIAIEEYRYNNLVSRRAVNRLDKNGQKTGTWVEVFDNGKIKTEINFVNGLPNGDYKEFSPTGRLLKVEKFINGREVSKVDAKKYDTLEVKKITVKKDYYPDGKIKSVKTFRDSVPYGRHIFYDKNGNISKVLIYNELGILTAEGKTDTADRKQGNWTFYYLDGNKLAQGNFSDDKKTGKWTYFYENGNIKETGRYEDGYPDGVWKWYYEDGKLLRQENYVYGLRNGKMFELSPEGDTVVTGKYTDNEKHGKWHYQIGDEYSEGEYYMGQKTGLWLTYYYPSMKLKCKDNYLQGKKDGKHICFYPNKKIKEKGEYSNGKKRGKWYYYKPDGSVDYTAEYIKGEIVKVNDLKIK